MTPPRVLLDGVPADTIAPTQVDQVSWNRRGSESVTWSMPPDIAVLRSGRRFVEVSDQGLVIWSGLMDEPSDQAGSYSATGLAAEAYRYPALDGSGLPTTVPNTAIDQAITKGLRWTRVQSFDATALSSDLQGEHPDLGTLLDAWTAKQDEQWRVLDRGGYVEHYTMPTSPTWVLAPGFALGTESSEYVSHLAGMRLAVLTVTTPSGSASTRRVVAVPEVGDADAAAKWGYRSDVIDLTELGVITEAFAQSILNGLRKKGRHRFGWTGSLLVKPGQLSGPYGAPARISMPRGGDVVRIPRFWDDTQDYANHLYADVWVDRVILRPKDDTVELQPVGMNARDFTSIPRWVVRASKLRAVRYKGHLKG